MLKPTPRKALSQKELELKLDRCCTERLHPAFTHWLDPNNSDADGKPRDRLSDFREPNQDQVGTNNNVATRTMSLFELAALVRC